MEFTKLEPESKPPSDPTTGSAPEKKLEETEEERDSDWRPSPLGHRRRGRGIRSLVLHTREFQQAERHAKLGGLDCHTDRGFAVFDHLRCCFGVTLTSMAVVLAAVVAVLDYCESDLVLNSPLLPPLQVGTASAG